jgi:dolichyl-phosphate beta-glucosyltransferase
MQPNSPTPTASGTTPFTLVIPAYNEERRLPQSILDIRAFFKTFNIPYEVIIVIEKSKDRTVELAKKAVGDDEQSKHFKIVANDVQKGKGYAVKCGMLQAQGDCVFFMDADLSTPLAEVIAFLGHFAANPQTDVIIGSRADAQSLILKKQSWMRRNMGRTFNFFVQLFGIPGIKDTQCGFKAFRAAAAREVFSRQTLNGFAFDVEVLLLADRLGYKIDILPVRWVNSPDSKVNMLIDPLKMLLDLIKIRRIVRKTVQAKPLASSKLPSP